MKVPKVSIIVPVYNVEKYLQCCVDSLLHQTLADIEIILVDDGSPDNSPAICDEYAKQDDRVKVIHKKNAGQGLARNTGLETAAGEYVTFVDSDDFVDTEMYRKLYSIAMDTNADAVYCTFQRFDNQGKVWGQPTERKKRIYQTEADIRELMLGIIANRPEAKTDRDIECSTCCAIYRNDMIKTHGVRFKSERKYHSEDLLFNLDFLSHSSNVTAISDAFYNYRENPASFCHAVNPDKIDKYYFYYQYLLEKLKANGFGTEGYLRATRHFIGYLRSGIRQYLQSSVSKKEKIQWLKQVSENDFCKEIATSYPYKSLPVMYALHFYLLYKKRCHLLCRTYIMPVAGKKILLNFKF